MASCTPHSYPYDDDTMTPQRPHPTFHDIISSSRSEQALSASDENTMMILMKTTNVRLFLVGLVATSWLFVLVTPQQEPGVWSGCIDPDKSKSQNLVRIQQPSRVCFSIANDTDWNGGFASYLRASFEPKADVYSRFHIPNCKRVSPCFVIFFFDTNPISIPHFYICCCCCCVPSTLSSAYRDLVQRKNSTASSNNIFKSSPVITISASSQTALSFVRVYYDAAKDRVYPFLTAIMDVDRGVVKGITWDNACVFCGGTECLENTYNYDGVPQNQSSAGQTTRSCFVSTEDCNALLGSNSSSTVCDITVYTVWTGTDANGIALQSQAYRFSEFPAQELSDRITQLLVPDAAADLINSGGGDGSNTTRNRLLSSSSHGAAAAVLQVMEDHYHQSQSVDGTNGAVHSAIISEDGDL